MKILFLVFLLSGIIITYAIAQDKPKDTKFKGFSLRNSLHDSLPKSKSLSLDSFIRKGDNSVSIPNAYAQGTGIIYTMPVKNLKGKGLAPMPGTENLDKIEFRGQLDSLKIIGKDKK